jgi:hypothetical protein
MKTDLECIPCFMRQTIEAARFVTQDPSIHERVLREVMRGVAEMDFSEPPPSVAVHIHRRLRELLGNPDPYKASKDKFNTIVAHLLDTLTEEINQSRDPFAHAVRLAIAGNVIDLGVNGGLTEPEVHSAVERALHEPFSGDIEDFKKAADSAESILYLADNAGEIGFDRLLVEQFPKGTVTVATRGAPVINDVTKDDALAVGMDAVAEVVDNGSDAPGTVLELCSDEFRKRFEEADLIIAKGQGNYETLNTVRKNIVFLFKVKCSVAAGFTGRPIGTHILLQRRVKP